MATDWFWESRRYRDEAAADRHCARRNARGLWSVVNMGYDANRVVYFTVVSFPDCLDDPGRWGSPP